MNNVLATPTSEVLGAQEAAREGRFFNPEDADSATQPDTEVLSPTELARAARLAVEAREDEQRFYIRGLEDFVAGNRDTDAAKFYIEYWRSQSDA